MVPAPQPYQRRTARKVALASSGPLNSKSSVPVSSKTRQMTACPLVASRRAEVAKASMSSAPSFFAMDVASLTNSMSFFWPASEMEPSSSRNLISCSGCLCELNGIGRAPG